MKNSIMEFIDAQNSNKTKRKYQTCVVKYLRHIYGVNVNGKKNVDIEKYEDLARQYISEDREYDKDLVGYIRALKKEGRANLSISSYVSAVKSWLTYSRVDLTAYQIMIIRKATPSSKRGATHEDILDGDKIRQILSHAPTKLQAIILTMCSSGMRPGEAVGLDIDDVDLDNRRIWIRDMAEDSTKTKESRYTFFSEEAKLAIVEWLKVRDQCIETAQKRNYCNGVDNNKLFPFSYRVLLDMWTRAVTKAGLRKIDRGTGRLTLRPHACRKFFSSVLSKTNIGDTFIESLLGHESGVKHIYKNYTEQDVFERYQSAESAVTIHKGDVTRRLEEHQERITRQTEIIEDIQTKNISLEKDLKDRITDLEKENTEMREKNKIDKREVQIIGKYLLKMLNKIDKANKVMDEITEMESEMDEMDDIEALLKFDE